MKTWLIAHARALRSALRRLVTRPLEALLNVLTLATALALPTFAYVTLENVSRAAGRMDAMPQVSVFLAPDQSEMQRVRIEHDMKALAGVRTVRFIGRDEALRELKSASGSTDLLAGLAANSLPDAYLFQVRSR